MNAKFPLAIAQSPVACDTRSNGRQIREMMKQASKEAARLIHFPEGALSGYAKAQISDWADVDWPLVYQELRFVMKASKDLGIWVVLGCNHRLTAPNRPHNSLFVISDKGELITRYDKRFCSHSELTDFYSPGGEAQIFDIDGFRFGLALCIEIQFPEVFAEYERLGVDCLLFSAYSMDPMFWIQAQAHAATNNFWLSFSVPAQCSPRLSGGLIGPNGLCLSRCNVSEEPQLQLVTLDRDAPELQIALTKARPWRRKARQGPIYLPSVEVDPRSCSKTNF